MIHFRHRSRFCQILRKKFSKIFENFRIFWISIAKQISMWRFEMDIFDISIFLCYFKALILNQTTSVSMKTFSEHGSRIFRLLPRHHNMQDSIRKKWYCNEFKWIQYFVRLQQIVSEKHLFRKKSLLSRLYKESVHIKVFNMVHLKSFL